MEQIIKYQNEKGLFPTIGRKGNIERELKTAKEGREIAGFVIFAAIVVLIFEILIAQGKLSKRREEYVG